MSEDETAPVLGDESGVTVCNGRQDKTRSVPRKRKSKMNLEGIKIVFVSSNGGNPMNPCSQMSCESRLEELVTISARIWARHNNTPDGHKDRESDSRH